MISVIVPCRNRFEQLCSCIDSIYAAINIFTNAVDNASVEVIIVNDHSELGFHEKVAEKYRHCCIIDSDGYGPGYARNLGIKKCHGEYLFFTDSDCVVDEHWILNGYQIFMRENPIVVQGVPWLFQKTDNPTNGLCEEKLYEIMFSKYVEGTHTVMTDSRNLLFNQKIVDYIGSEVFSEKTQKATAESRVFGKKCMELGIPVYFSCDVKVFHEDPPDMKSVCYQKYRHGSGRVLIWDLQQDYDYLKQRYFMIPINHGLPIDYILPAHTAFLLGFYNNIGNKVERDRFLSTLSEVFLLYDKKITDYSELDDYV